MAYRIKELCILTVRFVLQNGFRLLYLSRAKLCLNFISSVKLWVVLKFWCTFVDYISKQNRIKVRIPKNYFYENSICCAPNKLFLILV